MPKYYVLIKRKGAKKWIGAIPSKKGISKKKLQSSIRTQIKKGFTYRIITGSILKRMLSSLINKKTRKRKTTKKKRTIKRRKKKRTRRKR